MEIVNIKKLDYSIPNLEIHRIIQKIISGKELNININGFEVNYDAAGRYFILFDTIKFITDNVLLKNTVELINEFDFLKIDNQTIEILKNNLSDGNYTDLEKTKIESYIYSILLELMLLKRMFHEIYVTYNRKFIEFDCNINKTVITHNIDEIRKNCYKILLKHRTKNSNKNEVEKLIDSMIELDYFNESNAHENDIDYLQKRVNKLLQTNPTEFETNTTVENSHSETFSNNGFILFEYLLNNHIRSKGKSGRFSDIADYYWKMYYSEIQYIHQRPETFKEWFRTTYDGEEIGKIKTAENLKNIDRDKHYSNSLNWFKHKK